MPVPNNHVSEKEIILSEVPTKVQKIHVEGLNKTKNDIITKHVKSVFAAKNFEDMVMRSEQARITLQRLGIFKKIHIGIDIAHGVDAAPDGYEVTFAVKEGRSITGGVSTLVGTNEGSVLFNIRFPNIFGRAEKINTEYTYGTKSAVGCGLNFSKPLQGDPNLMYQASVFQNHGEFPWSGFTQVDRGISNELLFPTLLGHHSLRWEGVWRELSSSSRTTAFAIREQCGHSVKSSLKHTFTRDGRDNQALPNTGYKLQLSQELAGLGGDVHYWKTEGEAQYNLSLPARSVLQVCVGAGIVAPLHPGAKFNIADRFFLGGPLTLRGFNFKGVGPHQDGASLGADSYWSGGIHLYTPLPLLPASSFTELFRLHGFVNSGNLTDINLKSDYRNMWHTLSGDFRWSYGAGLVFRLGGIARLELNYCWPMRAKSGDSIHPGLQFGIGLNYL